jgi:uncharacterized membrane protein
MNYRTPIVKKLLRYFFQGLIFFAPAAVTLYILFKLFTYVDGFIQGLVQDAVPFKIPGLGILAIIILITLLGFVGQSIFFRPLAQMIDRAFQNAPLVKVLYSSIRDVLSAFVGNEKKFNKPVLVKVNKISDMEKIGFLTNEDLKQLEVVDKVAVYFPFCYGFYGELLIVPKDQVKPLNIPASEAMKFVVSGGVINL